MVEDQRFFERHNFRPPRTCKPCRAWLRLPVDERGLTPPGVAPRILRCKHCDDSFALGVIEERALLDRGMPLPASCRPCHNRVMAKARKGKELHDARS
jgi:hypothetical protein